MIGCPGGWMDGWMDGGMDGWRNWMDGFGWIELNK